MNTERGPCFPHIEVLRIGHRPERDKRITTHVSLVARAFGARGIHIDRKDPVLEGTVTKVNRQFGGDFFIRSGVPFKKKMNGWDGTIIHLTMYGMPLDEAVKEMDPEEKLLVVVGAEKVPREVYDMAHFNVSVGNQPHSEVSALALFLDRVLEGKELSMKMQGGELIIEPNRRGKTVVTHGSNVTSPGDPISRNWPPVPDPKLCLELLEAVGCSRPVILHGKAVRDLGLQMVRRSIKEHPDRKLDIDPGVLEAGLLVHDIGRSVTHSINHVTHGVRIARRMKLDERLVRMIHCHIGAGLTAPEAILLGLPDEDHLPGTLMERIVCHADSLVSGRKRRTLAEAEKKLRDKGANAGADRMLVMHRELEDELGIDIDELVFAIPKGY
ncbi:MAG: HDIG domain-containing protein [Candidatus Thermoplasmatota archaeon]|nr:HDIG domain-containing protein [Candidatus Thermoplasmatota archaeon]